MKSFIDSWRGPVILAVAIFGLGTLLIMEFLDNASKQMETQNEMIDLINFNQQILDDKNKLYQLNIRQGVQIRQMDDFIGRLYRRLQLYEPLPDLPGDKERKDRTRSEA